MGLDVYRGEAQEKIDGQQDIEKLAVAAMPYQEHAHCAHSGVTAGEGCCRTFSRRLGVFHELVEDSVGVSRGRKAVLVMAEVIAHGGKDAFSDVSQSNGMVIKSGPHHGNEQENGEIDEKRGQYDSGASLKLPIALEEII